MFLILDESRTEFGLLLQQAAERRQVPVLYLTAAEIVSGLTLDFFVSDAGSHLRLDYGGRIICDEEITGIWCGINAFVPECWTRFGPEDATYAAAEMQAVWLAILSEIACPVINRPALDTLAGTVISSPELFFTAHGLGLCVPLVVSLESGRAACELLRAGIPSQYTDLGEPLISETRPGAGDLPVLEQHDTHCRVKEEVTGRPVWIALIGDEALVSAPGPDGIPARAPARTVPRQVRSRLRALHRRLSLTLAEYEFRITADGTWVLCGCTRFPGVTAITCGNELFDRIIGLCGGEADARARLRIAG
jgi:hypothetical protein